MSAVDLSGNVSDVVCLLENVSHDDMSGNVSGVYLSGNVSGVHLSGNVPDVVMSEKVSGVTMLICQGICLVLIC